MWGNLSRLRAHVLGRLQGGRVDLIKVATVRDEDALTVQPVETVHPGIYARIGVRMIKDPQTGRLVENERQTVVISATELPPDVQPTTADYLQITERKLAILAVTSVGPGGPAVSHEIEVAR